MHSEDTAENCPPCEDPFWVEFTAPVAAFLQGGARTWADLQAWRAVEKYCSLNMVRECLAWLEAHGNAVWDPATETWGLTAESRLRQPETYDQPREESDGAARRRAS